MSFSLKIANGDLAFVGNQLDTVTDQAKLVQDLTYALLTPIGTDDMHPTFGSTIEDAVGDQNNGSNALIVKAEISRICSDYQKNQIARNQADASTYGKPTLTPAETLVAVNNIQTIEAQDKLLVKVSLETGTGIAQTNLLLGR